MLKYCLELGITQTAYIPECSGKFSKDPHCGTFLEIHKPGDPQILSEVRLQGQFTSGYRMAIISTTFQRNASRSICAGDHELWWVHRTRHSWVLQTRLPFRVASPRCDWNPFYNHYELWRTMDAAAETEATQVSGIPKERFLFSRPRTTGHFGYPGVGMGSLYIPPSNDSFHPTADFRHGDTSTYTWSPIQPNLDMNDGHLYPTHRDYRETYPFHPRRLALLEHESQQHPLAVAASEMHVELMNEDEGRSGGGGRGGGEGSVGERGVDSKEESGGGNEEKQQELDLRGVAMDAGALLLRAARLRKEGIGSIAVVHDAPLWRAALSSALASLQTAVHKEESDARIGRKGEEEGEQSGGMVLRGSMAQLQMVVDEAQLILGAAEAAHRTSSLSTGDLPEAAALRQAMEAKEETRAAGRELKLSPAGGDELPGLRRIEEGVHLHRRSEE